jgi:carbon monoxide dehydrogenase subunit G
VSSYQQQFFIDAPLASVWQLVGDPRRHPEWWPQAVEVRGESFEEGEEYVQVSRVPLGMQQATRHEVDRLEDLHEIRVKCQKTGRYARWAITEARTGTFVDAEMGMEPSTFGYRLLDQTAGRYYMRRWLAQAVDGLRAAAESARPGGRGLG